MYFVMCTLKIVAFIILKVRNVLEYNLGELKLRFYYNYPLVTGCESNVGIDIFEKIFYPIPIPPILYKVRFS